MGLKSRITEEITAAVKSRDQFKVDTLRMVISAVKNKEIEKKADIDDEAIISIISTLVKQRREAADLYRKGDREELAAKEEKEIELLKGYLPEAIEGEELARIVAEVAEEMAASSLADMGKVMKAVMARVAGRAEGNLVSDLVKKQLSA